MAEQSLPTRRVERALAEVIACLDPNGAPTSSLVASPDLAMYLRRVSIGNSRLRSVTVWLVDRPYFTPRDLKTWLRRLARRGTVDLDARDPDNERDVVATMSPRTRAELLDGMDPERFHQAALAAAAVLETTWVDADLLALDQWGGPMTVETEAFLFANFHALNSVAGDLLIQPAICELLHCVGVHYRDSPRHSPAQHVAYQNDLLHRADPLLGPEHPSTLRVRSDLGIAHARAGDHETAATLHERVLTSRQRTLGPDDQETFEAMGRLGADRRATGRLDDAVTLLERAFSGLSNTMRPTELQLNYHRNALVDTYRDLGRTDDALALRHEHVAAFVRTFGATHPFTLLARNELAATLAAVGRHGDADEEYRAVLDVVADARRSSTDSDPAIVAEAEQGLAAPR